MEMKKNRLTTLLFILTIFLFSCNKEEKTGFGDTQTNFEVDSIYKASTDGLLRIQTTSNLVSSVVGYVYCDFKPEPDSLIGKLFGNENATIPIVKDSYWRVHKQSYLDPNINVNMELSWTPMY